MGQVQSGEEIPDPWLLDSGASDPMSPVVSDFEVLGPSRKTVVILADGSTVPVLGEGTIVVRGESGPVRLRSVLFVPDLARRLLSVAAIYDHGGSVQWGREAVQLFGRDLQQSLLVARRVGSAWELGAPLLAGPTPTPPRCLFCRTGAMAVQGSGPAQVPGDWELWHSRLAHVSPQSLRSMREQALVTGMVLKGEVPREHACPPCLEGKMAQLPFPKPPMRVTAPWQRIHMDLLGKLEVQSFRSQAKYMLLLKDEGTGYAWCRFLRKKKQASQAIRDFFHWAERQHIRIKGFLSDRGGEFLSEDFVLWLSESGVEHQLTVPYTPQQNGMCERTNRTLCGRARALMRAAGLPKRFWEDALRYTTWCANRTPTKRAQAAGTPFAALHHRVPDVSRAKVWGCLAHVWVPEHSRRKLDARAQLGVFLGPCRGHQGVGVLDSFYWTEMHF